MCNATSASIIGRFLLFIAAFAISGCGPRFNSSSFAVANGAVPVPSLFQWVVQDGKSSGTPGTVSGSQNSGPSVAMDASGNMYVVGTTTTALNGQTLHGNQDLFISKYNSSGTLQWTVEDGAAGATVWASSIALDSIGSSVYVVASTSNALDGQALHGAEDLVISKYTSSGTWQWTVEDGAASANVTSGGITVDSAGNVFTTGTVSGAALDGQTLHGFQDFFISKYDSAGTFQWTVEDGSTSYVFTNYGTIGQIAVDSSGNVYVAGNTNGWFDGQFPTGFVNLFITKYNSSGARQWTVEDGASFSSMTLPTGIAIDASGNIYVAAEEMNSALDGQTLHGNTDLLITKYNSSGTRQWTVEDGAAGAGVSTGGIVLDATGSNAYVAASVNAALDGQTLQGVQDLILTKYSSAGALQWTVQHGAAGATVLPGGVGLDVAGNIYLAGTTKSVGLDGQTLQGIQDLVVTKYNSAKIRQWTLEDGGANGLGTTQISGSTQDFLGNVYVTGTTNSALDGQALHGTRDFFVSKYDSAGMLQWTVEDGVSQSTISSGQVTVDSTGNVYITGTVDVSGLDGQSLQGKVDFFIAKYDSGGVRQWTVEDGAPGAALSLGGIANDSAGNVYLAGTVSGAAIDGQTLQGNYDLILTKYNSAGTRQWTVEDGAANAAVMPHGIAVDSLSNIYISGETTAAIDGQTLHGGWDLVLTKYNSSGARQWTVEDGGGVVQASYVALDASGNVYIAGGTTSAPLDGQTLYGTNDLFITEYNSSGVRQWTVEDGAPGARVTASGIALDSSGTIYVTGWTTAAFDGQAFQGSADLFLTKYNSAGIRQSTLIDSGGTTSAYLLPVGVGVDSSGHACVSGWTDMSIHSQAQHGIDDLFIIKY